jgi:hypothetical protein
METITIDNNQLIGEVKKLLKTFPSVVLPVKGTSMLPFIIGSKESVELVRWEKDFQIGDIVLAWTKDYYVIHRIIKINGDDYTLMGDGNIIGTESCKRSDIVAKAEYVVDKHGNKHYLYTPRRCQASRLWNKLKPVRRWILAIYRRTILKMI